MPVQPGAADPLGAFTCNICGAPNHSRVDTSEREQATCAHCRSSIRFRSILLALSRALFGLDLPLPDFPKLTSLRGLGVSDSEIYASRLGSRFSYCNTYYHRDPKLDLLRPEERDLGQYDFILCSDVLEHVPEPASDAFRNLGRLLKPTGVLILTVPYSLEAGTIEHYPGLTHTGFSELDGRLVMVARSASGEYRVFDQLVFHGGDGSTLERRIFSEDSLRRHLAEAGFAQIDFEATGSRKFGVAYSTPCSLPVVARRGPFALSASGVSELVQQLALLPALRRSRWLRLGRRLGVGPDLGPV